MLESLLADGVEDDAAMSMPVVGLPCAVHAAHNMDMYCKSVREHAVKKVDTQFDMTGANGSRTQVVYVETTQAHPYFPWA